MSNDTSVASSSDSSVTVKPWWKYPLVWMVVGGPLSVIVACAITWFVIMRQPDPVLDSLREEDTDTLAQQGSSYAPAQKGRNHAATGYRPASAVEQPASSTPR